MCVSILELDGEGAGVGDARHTHILLLLADAHACEYRIQKHGGLNNFLDVEFNVDIYAGCIYLAGGALCIQRDYCY